MTRDVFIVDRHPALEDAKLLVRTAIEYKPEVLVEPIKEALP